MANGLKSLINLIHIAEINIKLITFKFFSIQFNSIIIIIINNINNMN